jgi:hypothetical protein
VLGRLGVRFNKTEYKGLPETVEGHAYQDLIGQRVVVRYHPDDEESVVLYHAGTGARIGEFIREDLYRRAVGARAANQRYIRPLKERTTDYRKALEKEDRAVAKVSRKAEIEAKRNEIRQQEARDGISHTPTRSEAQTRRKVVRDKREKLDLFEDLMD